MAGMRLFFDLANDAELRQHVKDLLREGLKTVTRQELQEWVNAAAREKLGAMTAEGAYAKQLREGVERTIRDILLHGYYTTPGADGLRKLFSDAVTAVAEKRVDAVIEKLLKEKVDKIATDAGTKAAQQFIKSALGGGK